MHFESDKARFLDRLFNRAFCSLCTRDLFDAIVSFAEPCFSETDFRKTNLLPALSATTEAHRGREWAHCVLSPRTNKWYAANKDSAEARSPMLSFEFAAPIHVVSYTLQSAGDCPHRDPLHWVLFGCFGDELDGRNQVEILHEYDGDKHGVPLSNNSRWTHLTFKIPSEKKKEELRFKFIGFKIIRGKRNMFDIQLLDASSLNSHCKWSKTVTS